MPLILLSVLLLLATGIFNPSQGADGTPRKTAEERLAALSPNAISARKSFVIALEGESYLFNPSAGVTKAPFLPGVYKAFGFSYDSRYFLYLKSDGGFPTFALYCYDLAAKTERLIANGVHEAAWSPASLRLAFIDLDPEGEMGLRVHDLARGSTEDVFSGPMNTEYLEWSADGNQIRYVSLTAPTETAFEDHSYEYHLREYEVYGGRSSVVIETTPGRLDPDAGASPGAARLRRGLVTTGEGNMRNFAASGRYAYATAIENGGPVVKALDPDSGAWRMLAKGQVYRATDDGVVLRRFLATGVEYQYVDNAAPETAQVLAAATSYLLPFQGSAYLVQGGDAFTSGVCDGARCLANTHKNGLGGALDWQQTKEEGQGNQHMLAVADGTVVSMANNITCNSVNTNCKVGYDDYKNPCPGNDGAGNYVLLAHSDGAYSLYAHLRSGTVNVKANDKVTQGAYLADQGHSGSANSVTKYNTCGDHLHFQRQTGTGVFGQSIPTDFTEAPCVLKCLSAYVSDNVEQGAPPTTNLSVILNPATVIGSLTTVGNKVSLPTAAPAGGAPVALSSSDTVRASVPASVTVAAGNKSATFSIVVNGDVSQPMPVTITATRASATATADLTVSPPAVAQVTLAESPVGGGNPVVGNEVTLSGASGGEFTVALTSSKTSVAQVPAQVKVQQGENAATFDLTTSKVTANTTVTIKATGGGVTKSASLVVKPFDLTSVTLSPASVLGGVSTSANKVTLSAAAPPGGTVVTLSSSNSAVAQTPESVTVPAGATASPAFAITTSVVGVTTPVSISASLGTGKKSATLTVNPVAVASVTLSSPANGANDVPTTTTLTWSAASGAASFDVRLGTSSPPPLAANTTGTSYSAKNLTKGTTYYWQVIAKNGAGSTSSAIWSFTTQQPVVVPSKVGVFLNGQWYLDLNGNGAWESGVDRQSNFGWAGTTQVLGDWNGDGTTEVGVFYEGFWYLDYNSNGVWDGFTTDKGFGFGWAGATPVVGDWNGDGKTEVGVFKDGSWYLDLNGNGVWEPGVDRQSLFGWAGVTPIVGDWNGDGKTKVGVFHDGFWYLDYNGNGVWDGLITDEGFEFGFAGVTPVVGDWNGDGKTKAGVFQDGLWSLDLNGNGVWEPAVDRQSLFGWAGATPLVGDWNGDGKTKVAVFSEGSWYLDSNGNGAWDGLGIDKSFGFGWLGVTPVAGKW